MNLRMELTRMNLGMKFIFLFIFFSVVYLTLALNSPVKIYSLVNTNKKFTKK